MSLFHDYQQVIASLPDPLQDAAGVLYSVVLTVIAHEEHHDIHDFEFPVDNEWIDPKTGKLYNLNDYHNEQTFSSVLIEQNLMNSRDLNYSFQYSKPLLTIEEDNSFCKKYYDLYTGFTVNQITNEGLPSASGLIVFIKQAMLRRLLNLILKDVGNTNLNHPANPSKSSHYNYNNIRFKEEEFKTTDPITKMPIVPIESYPKRKLRETELLNFSSLSSDDFFRYRKLHLANEMIKEKLPILPNFTKSILRDDGEDASLLKRRFSRLLSGTTLLQILSRESLKEPHVMTKYDSWTDELIWILFWDNPPRRQSNCQTIYHKESFTRKVLVPITNTHETVATPPVHEAEEEVVANTKTKGGKVSQGKKKPATQGKMTKQPSDVMQSPKTTSREGAFSPNTRKDPQPQFLEKEETITKIFGTDNVILTPAGRSLVTIKKYLSSGESWLTIHTAFNCILGLRQSPMVRNAFDGPEGRKNSSEMIENVPNTTETNKSKPVSRNKSSANPSTSQSDSMAENAHESLSLQPVNATISMNDHFHHGDGIFFCQTSDDARYSVSTGPAIANNKKPDGFGIVILHCQLSCRLSCLVTSNGTVRITPPYRAVPMTRIQSAVPVGSTLIASQQQQQHDPLGVETHRCILNEGIIVKTIRDGLFVKETIYPNGNRQYHHDRSNGPINAMQSSSNLHTLLRLNSASSLNQQSFKPTNTYGKFLLKLYFEAPHVPWDSVLLQVDGSIVYLTKDMSQDIHGNISQSETEKARRPSDSNPQTDDQSIEEGRSVSTSNTIYLLDYVKEYVDAETKAIVKSFADGRIITYHRHYMHSLITYVQYPDQTSTTLIDHLNANDQKGYDNRSRTYTIEKSDWPSVEIDLEIDYTAMKHAQGCIVPINKGGNRTRMRIGMNDGTAIFVKYDTRVTAKCNGSIKLVRRDKTAIVVDDSGIVDFKDHLSWDEKMQRDFEEDCADPIGQLTLNPNVRSSPSLKEASISRHHVHFDESVDRQTRNVTVPSNTQRTNKSDDSPTRELQLTNKINASPSNPSRSQSSDVLLTSNTQDTKFIFDLKNMSCKIEDYEYNCFNIDMASSPLSPIVKLAGEVEGLKPTAVSDTPIDPKVFFINRNGTAIESVSVQDARISERLSKLNPDTKKAVSTAHPEPSDLADVTQHSYFTTKRPECQGDHMFRFEDIFGPRSSLRIRPPATYFYISNIYSQRAKPHTSMTLKRLGSVQRESSNESVAFEATKSSSKIQVSKVLVERLPLSQQGYISLTESINRWERFCFDRDHAINQYNVHDPRTRDQIDEEYKIQSRLKKAYKLKKLNKKKALLEAASSNGSKDGVQDVNGKFIYQPGMKLEGVNELDSDIDDRDSDDDEESIAFSSDDEEEAEVDPIEREIVAAFYEYGIEVTKQSNHEATASKRSSPLSGKDCASPAGFLSDGNATRKASVQLAALPLLTIPIPEAKSGLPADNANDDAMVPAYLPKGRIQAALIQIMNALVSKEDIHDELCYMGLNNVDCIYFSDFKRLYHRISYKLTGQGNVEEQYDHSNSEDHSMDNSLYSKSVAKEYIIAPDLMQGSIQGSEDGLSTASKEEISSSEHSSVPQGSALHVIRSRKQSE